MASRLRNAVIGFRTWLANIGYAVVSVAQALWGTLRYWLITYDPKRRTFTEQFE